jgi:hypothetical protein
MPELETPAANVTESAPVVTAPTELPALSTLTPEQRQSWRETGELPKSQDSAPAKDNAAPDSAPDKNDSKKPAVTASDSAPDTQQQKPRQKTKEDTERRFQELTDRLKKAEERAEALERARQQPEKRDTPQVSQPVPEAYKPLDEKKYFADNPKATYEDFVRTAARHEAQWEAKGLIEKALASERQRLAQDAATREMQSKMAEVKERYPDAEEKVSSATNALMSDPQIAPAVKQILNESDVLVDVMYVLGSDGAELAKFVSLAKSNPGQALRKIALTEQLVKAELAKPAGERSTTERDESGKFVSSKAKDETSAPPQSKAPRPPVEVGGRGSAPEDGALAAVKAGDFRSAKAAFSAKYAAEHKL